MQIEEEEDGLARLARKLGLADRCSAPGCAFNTLLATGEQAEVDEIKAALLRADEDDSQAQAVLDFVESLPLECGCVLSR